MVLVTVTLKVKKEQIKEHKKNPHGSWLYIETLRSERIGLWKKPNII